MNIKNAILKGIMWLYRKLDQGVAPPPAGEYVMVSAEVNITPNMGLYVHNGFAARALPNLINAVGISFVTRGNYGSVFLVKGL
jgi:hypothetical protein